VIKMEKKKRRRKEFVTGIIEGVNRGTSEIKF